MSYATRRYRTRKWYIAHEILYFEPKRKRDRARKATVWENLILIRADDPEEAYQKAMEGGYLTEGPVRIDEAPGRCRFMGLRDLVLVYDKLEHGAELEWHDLRMSAPQLRKLIRPKNKLHAFNIGPRT